MNIIIDGIEPQFKVYQMTESIENKTYIGSTSYPLKCRMSGHRNSHNKVDMYFADVGWNNVIVQIIDTANKKDEMRKKENEHINNIRNASPTSLLNKNKAYTGMNRIEYARFSYANKGEYYKQKRLYVMFVKHAYKNQAHPSITKQKSTTDS